MAPLSRRESSGHSPRGVATRSLPEKGGAIKSLGFKYGLYGGRRPAEIISMEMRGDTKEQSLEFMCSIAHIVFCEVAVGRGLLPDCCFQPLHIETDKFTVLNASDVQGSYWARALASVGDAIRLEYVQDLMFIVYLNPDRKEIAVEVYTVSFGYSRDGGWVTISDSLDSSRKPMTFKFEGHFKMCDQFHRVIHNLRRRIRQLLRLPPEAKVTAKLSFNSRTPKDYQPPGFAATDKRYVMERYSDYSRIGPVIANYMGCFVKVESVYLDEGVKHDSDSPSDWQIRGMKNFGRSSSRSYSTSRQSGSEEGGKRSSSGDGDARSSPGGGSGASSGGTRGSGSSDGSRDRSDESRGSGGGSGGSGGGSGGSGGGSGGSGGESGGSGDGLGGSAERSDDNTAVERGRSMGLGGDDVLDDRMEVDDHDKLSESPPKYSGPSELLEHRPMLSRYKLKKQLGKLEEQQRRQKRFEEHRLREQQMALMQQQADLEAPGTTTDSTALSVRGSSTASETAHFTTESGSRTLDEVPMANGNGISEDKAYAKMERLSSGREMTDATKVRSKEAKRRHVRWAFADPPAPGSVPLVTLIPRDVLANPSLFTSKSPAQQASLQKPKWEKKKSDDIRIDHMDNQSASIISEPTTITLSSSESTTTLEKIGDEFEKNRRSYRKPPQ